jgi:hypothetical protein
LSHAGDRERRQPTPTTGTARTSWFPARRTCAAVSSECSESQLREDAQRIQSWHANAVRLAVKDTLWAGASTGGATCDGGAYQKQVKRAINWLLEQKMDVKEQLLKLNP